MIHPNKELYLAKFNVVLSTNSLTKYGRSYCTSRFKIIKNVSLQLEEHLCITPEFQEAFVSVPDTFNNAVHETVNFF